MRRFRDAWLVLTGRTNVLAPIPAAIGWNDYDADGRWIPPEVSATGTIHAPRGLVVDNFPPGITLEEH